MESDNLQSSSDSLKTVSLVLGSGAARGLVQIGVIRWLEQNGYEIRSIAGCSRGALKREPLRLSAIGNMS